MAGVAGVTQDPALLRLAATLRCPCGTDPDAAGKGVVAVTVERPSPLSAPIVFVWDGPGAPIAVLKEREGLKSYTEHLSYLLSRELGLHLVAATLPLEFVHTAAESQRQPTVAPEQSATVYDRTMDLMAAYCAAHGLPLDSKWRGTTEACHPVVPSGASLPDWLAPLAPIPRGCTDLQTPMRVVLDPSHQSPGDDAFRRAFLAAVSQEEVERLGIYCLLTAHLDATFDNVLLTIDEDRVRFVLVDTPVSLFTKVDPEDWDILSPKAGDTKQQYWFPGVLLFPHTRRPLSPTTRTLLKTLDPTAVTRCPEWPLLPPVLEAEARVRAVGRRLEVLRQMAHDNPDVTLQRMAFALFPMFERDYPAFVAQERLDPTWLDSLSALL
jgi:hypothetical protein